MLGWEALASLDVMLSSETRLSCPVGLGLVMKIQEIAVVGMIPTVMKEVRYAFIILHEHDL